MLVISTVVGGRPVPFGVCWIFSSLHLPCYLPCSCPRISAGCSSFVWEQIVGWDISKCFSSVIFLSLLFHLETRRCHRWRLLYKGVCFWGSFCFSPHAYLEYPFRLVIVRPYTLYRVLKSRFPRSITQRVAPSSWAVLTILDHSSFWPTYVVVQEARLTMPLSGFRTRWLTSFASEASATTSFDSIRRE